eukprot:3934552-Rhodomonas_salina.2
MVLHDVVPGLYDATPCSVLTYGMVVPGRQYGVRGQRRVYFPISLRHCYAMSGTKLAYRPTPPGTEQAHGAIGLRACYAKSGTELAYAGGCPYACCQAVRLSMQVKVGAPLSAYALDAGCPVLTYVSCYRPTRMIRDVWY